MLTLAEAEKQGKLSDTIHKFFESITEIPADQTSEFCLTYHALVHLIGKNKLIKAYNNEIERAFESGSLDKYYDAEIRWKVRLRNLLIAKLNSFEIEVLEDNVPYLLDISRYTKRNSENIMRPQASAYKKQFFKILTREEGENASG